MSIEAVLFDLDGVLVDTASYHYQAWKELADQLGFEFTKQDNERLKGIGRMESLEILLSIGNVQASNLQKIQWATMKNERYITLCSQMEKGEVLPGVLPFLEELKDNNLKIALGSASKNAPLILQRVGIESYFDAIIDGNHLTKGKPDPEVFLLGAAALNVPATQCVVFEDAEAGIQAANAAGMYSIGVGEKQQLPQAKHIIPNFAHFRLNDLRALQS